MSIIDLIIALVLVCLACWVVRTLCAAFKVPEPVPAVLYVVIVVLFVGYVLQALRGGPLGHPLHF
jgi:hypothetical protein